MNKPLIFFAALIAVILSCLPHKSCANNAGGGELIYEWVQDSTYRFYFRFYRDCSGSPEPASVTMCVKNTCNSLAFNRTLNQIFNPITPVPPVPAPYCSGFKTNCDSPASPIQGRKTIWYTDTCTLPSRCNYWSFSVTIPGRPAGNTIANAGTTDMYIEATLNNTANYQGNHSPYFSVQALPFVCDNTPYTFNNGAADPDNDSLVTEVIYPQNANGACPAAPVNATLATSSPPLSVPVNPIQTGNTFSLNSLTGQFAFTPAQPGGNTLAFRVSEYRNGVKIGSVMREVSFHILSCAPQTSTVMSYTCFNGAKLAPPTNPFPVIHACPHTFSFCFSIKAADPNAKLAISDNHTMIAPGSNIAYINQYTDSVSTTFSWTPSAIDTGLKVLSVTVIDTVCKYPGIFTHQTFTIPISIWSRTRAIADTINICEGTSAQLHAIGGGNFQWAVLNGLPGSLSCTNCPSPIATPSVNSQYEVISTLNYYCGYRTDTVTVNVTPSVYPSIQITANPGHNVWPGLNVTFNATATACNNAMYQWQKNGVDMPGAVGPVWTSTTLADMDVITCRLTCNDTCALPKDTTSNAITMQVAVGINETRDAGQLHIYPNPNEGRFTISGGALLNTAKLEVEIVNSIGQVVYKHTINKQKEASDVAITIPGIVPGIYQLSIRTPAGTRSTPFTVID